jgi:hypothetical protein
MRSTPTCEIHTNVVPIGMRRDKATMEAHERSKRMNKDHPNKPSRELVTEAKNKTKVNPSLCQQNQRHTPPSRKKTMSREYHKVYHHILALKCQK